MLIYGLIFFVELCSYKAMVNDVKKIIKAAGGTLKVAQVIHRHPSAVSKWKRIPPVHVRILEKLTGIPREELRPDIFGKEER